MLNNLIRELKSKSSKEKAELSKRFFKESYTETEFLGLTMPEQRKIASKYLALSFANLQKLLDSKIHEHRMVAGIILIKKFQKNPEEVFNFYIKNVKKFNNWDLVDVTCNQIVGKFLLDKKRKILYDLAKSKNLWEKRISMVSTGVFISKGDFGDALKIAKIHLGDKHDLMHKAVGWMLREIGKRDANVLRDFLKTNYKKLPRTTLRYSIEKFDLAERKKWLKGEFN